MRTRFTAWTIILAVMSVAAVFLLAACGDDKDNGESTGDQGTPAEEATQPPDETVDDGADDGDDSEASGTDPCSLLTKEEVEAAVGNPVEDGAEDFASCGWDSDPEDISVSVHLTSIPADLCADSRPEGVEDLPDLGVEAWWEYTEAMGTGDVIACLEDTMVQLVVIGAVSTTTEEAPLRAAADDLMPKVLDRLGG